MWSSHCRNTKTLGMKTISNPQKRFLMKVNLDKIPKSRIQKIDYKNVQCWPCPSPVATLWKVGPESHLSITAELTLGAGVMAVSPEVVNMGEPAQPLVCPVMAWRRKRCPPPPALPLVTCGRQESCPCVLPAAALG